MAVIEAYRGMDRVTFYLYAKDPTGKLVASGIERSQVHVHIQVLKCTSTQRPAMTQ